MKVIDYKKDYMIVHVKCDSVRHPDLEILMPISQDSPIVLQFHVCPSCYSNDADVVRKYDEPYRVRIEDIPRDAHARRTHENGSAVGTMLYSLKCEGKCKELSLFKPLRMRWKDKLDIKMCPVCGSDRYKFNGKYDANLTLTPKNLYEAAHLKKT